MAGEPQERIGVELVVTDNGTPVVKRHTEETRRALGEVERASKSTTAAVSGGMTKAGAATASLGQTMEKSRTAAMALAGGLGQVGGRASMAAAAMSQLVVSGLNPLGVALAAASVGLGLYISKQGEAEEAARKHTEALKGLFDEARRVQLGVADIRLGTGGADLTRAREGESSLAREIGSLRGDRARLASGAGFPAGSPEAVAAVNAISALDEKIADLEAKRAQAAGRIQEIEGKIAAEKAKQLAADEEALRVAREKMELGTLVIQQRTAEARARDALLAGRSFAAAELGGFLPPALPTVGGDRMVPDAFSAPGMPPHSVLAAGFGASSLMDTQSDEQRARALARRDVWLAAGHHAGDAMGEGISDSLSTAVLTGRFDLADLGRTMGEMLVRTFMDALVQAAIGDQLRAGFQQLFASLGGAIGLGGPAGAPPGGGETPVFAPSAQARGPGTIVVVEPAPVMSERVLRSASDEAVRARVSIAYQGQGTPGRRA